MIARTVTLLTGQVALGVFLLANTLFVARWLGPEDRGKLAVLVFTPSIAVIVLNFGVNQAAAYIGTRRRELVPRIIALNLGNTLLFALPFVLVALLSLDRLLGSYYQGIERLPVIISFLTILPLLYINLSEALLTTLDSLRLSLLVRVSQGVFTFLLNLVLVGWWGGGYLAAICAFGGGALGSALLLWFLAPRAKGKLMSATGFLREALPFGVKPYVNGCADYFLYRSQVPFLNLQSTHASVGLFSVSLSLAEINWYLTTALRPVLFSSISTMTAADAAQQCAKALRLISVFGALVALAMFLLSLLVFSLVLPEFAAAVPLLAILLAATFLASYAQLASSFFHTQGHTRTTLLNSLTGAAMAAFGYQYGARVGGGLGIAWATFVVYLLYALAHLVTFAFHTRLSLLAALIPTARDFADVKALIREKMRGAAR